MFELKLKYLQEWINHRIDIVTSEPRSWEGMRKHNLPTFEYYLKNCVEDKGGDYDFTVRRYKTVDTIKANNSILYKDRFFKSSDLQKVVSYSIWMSTPFNFKEEVIYNGKCLN